MYPGTAPLSSSSAQKLDLYKSQIRKMAELDLVEKGSGGLVPDLEPRQLPGHFLLLSTVALPVFLEPGAQIYRIHFEDLTDPAKAARMILVSVEPIQSILTPLFPLFIGSFLGGYNIPKGLKQNS